MNDITNRCQWCQGDETDELYHDTQWGVPIHDDRKWFEYLTLEGAQAGLSWRTIVHKIPGYKIAFENFDIEKVANMSDTQLDELLKNPNIVRNRLKVYSTRNNAQQIKKIQDEFETFDAYIWAFVNNKPIQNNFKSLKNIPSTSDISDKLSNDLKKRGFKFIGSTICYALMQASGMVNDHEVSCFKHKICAKL